MVVAHWVTEKKLFHEFFFYKMNSFTCSYICNFPVITIQNLFLENLAIRDQYFS